MRKVMVLAVCVLATGLAGCGPSKEELARKKAEEREAATRAAIEACNQRNATSAQANAVMITEQQTLIKTTLDRVSEGGTGIGGNTPSPNALDWSVEIAALDPNGWRWTETTTITRQKEGVLSTTTDQVGSTIAYSVNPADLQETATVVPHDDGTAALRFYCKVAGCIKLNGATRSESASTMPFSSPSAQAGTVTKAINSNDWLLSTRTRAEALKGVVEKLIQLQNAKPQVCTNPDGTPGPGATPVQGTGAGGAAGAGSGLGGAAPAAGSRVN